MDRVTFEQDLKAAVEAAAVATACATWDVYKAFDRVVFTTFIGEDSHLKRLKRNFVKK